MITEKFKLGELLDYQKLNAVRGAQLGGPGTFVCGEGTYQRKMPGRAASPIAWFKLTDVSAEPMGGTKMLFQSSEEEWQETSLEGIEIYPHPEAEIMDYEVEQIVPCVKSGGQWHSLDGVAGEGSPVIWGQVIEAIEKPEPGGSPEEGLAQYTVHLLSQVGEEEAVDIHPRPLAQEANYEDLINDPPDMRLFVPWFQAGDIVPLVRRSVTVIETTETLYFFDLQMTRVRTSMTGPVDQSIMWNDEEHRLIAVFKD